MPCSMTIRRGAQSLCWAETSGEPMEVRPGVQGPMPTISRGDEARCPLLEGGDGEGGDGGEGEHRAVNPVEKTPLQCIASPDFWMLFLVNGISSGAGLTLLNNLGQQARPPAGGGARRVVAPLTVPSLTWQRSPR